MMESRDRYGVCLEDLAISHVAERMLVQRMKIQDDIVNRNVAHTSSKYFSLSSELNSLCKKGEFYEINSIC